MQLGKNIEAEVKGNKLILTIDLSKELGKSASGKSMTVATTSGNTSIPGADGVKIGINCYKPDAK